MARLILTSSFDQSEQIMGGDICLNNTRITLIQIFRYVDHGMTDEQILYSFPSIFPNDLKMLRKLFNEIKGQF